MAVIDVIYDIIKSGGKAFFKEPRFMVENVKEYKKRPHFVIKNVGDRVAMDIVITPSIKLQFQPFRGGELSFNMDSIEPNQSKVVYYLICEEDVPDKIELKIEYYNGVNSKIRKSKVCDVFL